MKHLKLLKTDIPTPPQGIDALEKKTVNLYVNPDGEKKVYNKQPTIIVEYDDGTEPKGLITNTLVRSEINPVSAITRIHMNDYVTTINQNAARGTSHYKSLTIPKNVKTIGQGAFSGCTDLEKVYIEGTPTSGLYTFKGCPNLKEITFQTPLGSYTCHSDQNLTKAIFLKDFTSLPGYYFWNCTSLKTIGVKGSGASIEFSNTLKTLGEYDFDRCSGLTEVILPEGLETINNYAFSACENIKRFHFPSTIKTLKQPFGTTRNVGSSKCNVTYNGTIEEFQKINITKVTSTNLTIKVHCNDGDISVVFASTT